MRRLKNYQHRTFETPGGLRLMGYARGQLLVPGPEEHVRQSVLRTLVEEYGYPREALLAEEPVARGTENRRRADVLVQLPGSTRAPVILREADAEERPSLPPYSAIFKKVRSRLPVLESFVLAALPDTLDLSVDGNPAQCSVHGLFGTGHGLSLYAVPTGTSERHLGDLPPVLVAALLGYGRTPAEKQLARSLNFENVKPTHPGSKELVQTVDQILEAVGPELCVEDALSHDGISGWILIRHQGEALGVLAYVNRSTDEWTKFAYKVAEGAETFRLLDGRIAYRQRLDHLKTGDRVFIERLDDGNVIEGEVADATNEALQVNCGEYGIVGATIKLDAASDWLLGRIEPCSDAEIRPIGTKATAVGLRTFIVVECKAPQVALTEEVLAQGLAYVSSVGASFLVLTNGRDVRTLRILADGNRDVEDLPDYKTAVSAEAYEVTALPVSQYAHLPIPQDARSRPDVVRFHGRYREGVIGADLKPEDWWAVLTVDDILRTPATLVSEAHSAYGVTVAEDLGIRFHEPTTPAGGAWPGLYRDFLVRAVTGSEHVLGLVVAANGKVMDHPAWGNTQGTSTLTAALSDDAAFFPNLNLDLGRYLDASDTRLRLWHSGRMTAGRGGVKNARVVQHVSSRQPSLVSGGKIQLGSIPARSNVTWDEMKDFVARIAAYVLARDELKKEVRAERRVKRG